MTPHIHVPRQSETRGVSPSDFAFPSQIALQSRGRYHILAIQICHIKVRDCLFAACHLFLVVFVVLVIRAIQCINELPVLS